MRFKQLISLFIRLTLILIKLKFNRIPIWQVYAA